MKYCIQYYSDFRYFDKVDEIILTYKDHNENIVNFVNDHFTQEQRVIVDIMGRTNELKDILPILTKLYCVHPFMTIKADLDAYKELQAQKIPFFFAAFCKTAGEVCAAVALGVSDVYIVEDACFDIKNIGEYCASKNVSVRMFPNIAQYPIGFKDAIPGEKTFFVRPEDIKRYDEYVDVFELIGPADRLSVLFNIYKSEQWLGDLKELILGLDTEFYNAGIDPRFGMTRLDCQHKCMYDKCNLCPQYREIANTMKNLNLEVRTERVKDWLTDELKVDEEVMLNEQETDSGDDVPVSEG